MIKYVPEIICPYCGGYAYEQPYADEGCYHCVHTNLNTLTTCGWVGVYCKNCNKLMREKDFGLRGDVYECKECGKPQWGYTEFMRNHKDHIPKENLQNNTRNHSMVQQAKSSAMNYLEQFRQNPDQFGEDTLIGIIGKYINKDE